MSISEEILVDVRHAASLRNLDVMRLAWQRVGTRCPHCNFPENAGQFIRLLSDYIDARVNLTHARQRWDNDGSYTWVVRWMDRASVLRVSLTAMWPCEECILRFNPTFKSMFRGIHLYGRAMPKLRQGDLFDE